METPTSIVSRFGGNDHALIESGLLADYEVECDGKTWRLHKVILCSRSSFFKKLILDYPSQVKTGNHVAILDFNAQQMGLVISYIYAGNIQFNCMVQKGERLQTAIQLLILDAYFDVDNLYEDVNNHLYDYMIPQILISARLGDLSVDLKDWVAAGRLVYSGFSKARDKIKEDFLKITFDFPDLRKQILKSPEFKELCLKYRDFSSDSMLKLLKDGIIVPQ
ncbi:hypothetical protein LX32DRAFT_3293 [Colletotrichum zoysiae]|uniref:BTB domain-containing protein n=1 Tax=Colletotrichum zoysiae TaxID=1216348 RepID=A0AAD9MAN6_9PEZI|nr:hypothetical protein LX32DRAFT_3293 [Colletotrichum zoysiae]